MADNTASFTHLVDIVQRPAWLQRWERLRHGKLHWLVECIGELLGVYFYVYCGVGATLVYNIGNITGEPIGSFFTIGSAYAIGIVLALSICASVSGGHFNPCVTIARAVWQGFPLKKVPLFITAQILGAYFACALVYAQYRTTIKQIEEGLIASGKYDAIQFSPNGLAGAFGLYVLPTANLRDTFTNEFFVDFFLGLVIWGISDPTNFFTPPVAAPWVVGFAYGVVIWGYAPAGLAANSARDVGGRLFALSIWGMKASGGKYAAIAALTNIPATLFATLIYELIMTDSSRVLPRPNWEFYAGHKAHLERRELGMVRRRSRSSSTDKGDGDIRQIEKMV